MSKNRLRNGLTILFLAVLGVKFFLPLVLKPLQDKRDQLAVECSELQGLQDKLKQLARCLEDLKEAGTKSLPYETSLASIRFEEYLRSHCVDSQLQEATIAIQEPSREEGLGVQFPATISGNGTLHQIGELVDRLSSCNLNQRIVHLEVRELDSETQYAAFEIATVGLSLQLAANDGQRVELQRDSRGFGDFLATNRFGRWKPKAVVEPALDIAEMEKTDASSPSIQLPAQNVPNDLLSSTRLVAIVERNGEPHAWFHDSFGKIDWVVDSKKGLTIGDFFATIQTIGEDNVVMKQGFREFSVGLGHSIRESLTKEIQ